MVIETKLETFATKEDLRKTEIDLVKWVGGTALTIVLFIVGFGLAILSRLPAQPPPTPVS